MSAVSERILERVTNIKNTVESNMKNNRRVPLCISDILLIQVLTGGTLRIDNRSVDSPVVYKKLQNLETNLKTMENVIFSDSEEVNGVNLLIGDLVDVALCSNSMNPVHTTVLRNISFLVIPDSEVYRSMQGTKLKRGSVCQKLLELNPNDIVDIVFKIKSFKSRMNANATTIRCTDDLVDLTEEEDFILLLHDDLAFMVATIEDENGEEEQQFYLISGKEGTVKPVQRQENYSVLGLFISIPELYEDDE